MNEPELPIEGDPHLELIEALGAVDQPSTATSERHLADLRASVAAAEAEHRPPVVRPLRRRPGRLVTGLIGIAAALLVVAAIDARPTKSNRADATTLERLATKASDTAPPDPDHSVLHLTYRMWSDEHGGDEVAQEPASSQAFRIEAWRRPDGTGLEQDDRFQGRDQRREIPASDPEASMYAWDEATQSCSLRRAGDAGILRTLQGRRIDTGLLESLPADPGQLRSALEHLLAPEGTRSEATAPEAPPSVPEEEDEDPATSCESNIPPSVPTDEGLDLMIDDAVTMLLGPWSSPDLRAAAFELLAERNDVSVSEHTDPLGRQAVAITVDGEDGYRFTNYIDPDTTEWLGLVGRNADGKRVTEELVETSEWVAEVPEA